MRLNRVTALETTSLAVALAMLMSACAPAEPSGTWAASCRNLAAFQRAAHRDGAYCQEEPLAGARQRRATEGCHAALSTYRAVAEECAGTAAERLALWELADCHRIVGDTHRAAALFTRVRELEPTQ